MLKLLLCLFTAVALGGLVLYLRQQRLELGYETNQLHEQIRSQQATLWNQQLQIATYTAPNAITQTVSNHNLKLVPQAPPPAGLRNWIDVSINPDAE